MQVYNEIINLSRSAGRDKLYQLTLGLGLPIVGTSGKCTAQNALVCGYVKDTLKKLSSPTDYTYTCVRRYVLDMLCNSQLNADGGQGGGQRCWCRRRAPMQPASAAVPALSARRLPTRRREACWLASEDA